MVQHPRVVRRLLPGSCPAVGQEPGRKTGLGQEPGRKTGRWAGTGQEPGKNRAGTARPHHSDTEPEKRKRSHLPPFQLFCPFFAALKSG
jgi:hypothetical protein